MVYDTIASYRLNPPIIEGYLKKTFGNYKFYVEVLDCKTLVRDKESAVAIHYTPSDDTAMEQLATSCDESISYPQNLINPDLYEYNLAAYYERLNEREDSLFQNDAEAALDFWEFDAQGSGASANLELNLRVPDNGS
ncbi:MAG: hypothetical protein Q9175_006780 [Cornicularia normoerica]